MNYCAILSGCVLALLGLAEPASAASTPAPAQTKTGHAAAPAASAQKPADRTEVTQSVFVIPASLAEGRNPFFPPSRLTPMPRIPDNKSGTNSLVDPTGIVLNGLTGPPKRTAMINGRTFELNEEAEVHLPSGSKLMLRCVEIKDDSATVIFNGQRRQLRLRLGA